MREILPVAIRTSYSSLARHLARQCHHHQSFPGLLSSGQSYFTDLRMDHFIFEGVGEGKYQKKFLQSFAEEIKIVHSGTKKRNILQDSEIKFIQSF